MVPGLLAGVVFYFILTVLNWGVETISSKRYRLRAYGRLLFQCLAAIAFTIFWLLLAAGAIGQLRCRSAVSYWLDAS